MVIVEQSFGETDYFDFSNVFPMNGETWYIPNENIMENFLKQLEGGERLKNAESSLPVMDIGARCRARRLKVETEATITNIIHQSSGKTKIVVELPFGQTDVFDSTSIFPVN